ncbi:MAG TPA: phage holin family protein [Bryobacteraceae bacterium]|jgi:uncharacterized membrane protein YqjE
MQEGTQPTFTQLFQDAFSSVREIIRSEVRLAKTETREEIGKAGRAGAILGGGVVLTLYALGLALLAGVTALSLLVATWLAFLIVAAVVGIAAVFLVGSGRRQLQQVDLKPQKTITTVKENLQWAKHQTE